MDHLAATHAMGIFSNPADAPQTRWVPVAADPTHPAASAAYFKAQARGFCPGAELRDWLLVIDDISQQRR